MGRRERELRGPLSIALGIMLALEAIWSIASARALSEFLAAAVGEDRAAGDTATAVPAFAAEGPPPAEIALPGRSITQLTV